MNLSVAGESTSQAHQNRASEEQLCVPQSDNAALGMLTIFRGDDASSSSATHGSASTTDDDDPKQPEPQKADTVDGLADETTNGDISPRPGQHLDPRLRNGQLPPKIPVMNGHHDYSLDRFVEDVDHRDKARLGDFRTFAHLETQPAHNKSGEGAKALEVTAEEKATNGVIGFQGEEAEEDDEAAAD